MECVPPPTFPVLEAGVQIVLISPDDSDGLSLQRMFDGSQATVTWFRTRENALAHLRENPFGVVVVNADVADGCWQDVLEALSHFDHPPYLIVSSRVVDESVWAEVLNLGGYDVLSTPFEPDEVLRVCAGAWLAWKHTSMEDVPPRKTAVPAADSHPAVDTTLATSARA